MGPSTVTRERRGFLRRAGGCAALLLHCAAGAGAAGAEKIDFSREIQPLLAKRCVACHGPDTQEAGLRLDDQAGATRELDSGGRAIVAGDAAASEILDRITSTDPDVQMPPEGARLTPAQVDSIRRWIDEGADAFRQFAQVWSEPSTPSGSRPKRSGRRGSAMVS